MAKKMYSYKEVEKHNRKGDCWIIIFGKVYNVSQFVDHPGGPEVLLMATGRDAADDFEVIRHSPEAREKMKDFYIGDIDPSTYPKLKTYTQEAAAFPNIFRNIMPILVIALVILLFVKNKV